jgi:hypothetical protein
MGAQCSVPEMERYLELAPDGARASMAHQKIKEWTSPKK